MNLQQQADVCFKNYDIRGITGESLTKELAYAIGNAFVQQQDVKTCLVGRDPRNGAKELHQALIQGLRDAGCNVTNAGVCSTSLLKWAAVEHDTDGLVITTASHNPPQYCGFKVYAPTNIALYEDNGLHDLKALLDNTQKAKVQGTYEEIDLHETYVHALLVIANPASGNVFIDPSGAAACQETKQFALLSNLDVTLYNAEEDPEFSLHPADPTQEEALEAAKEFCGINGCIGAVFDGDCDRIALIDEKGTPIAPDAWAAWYVSKTGKEGDVIAGAVGTTESLRSATTNIGGRFTLSKVGHPHAQRAVRENNAHIGAERSGHIYFPETHDGESPLLVILHTLNLLEGTLHEEIKPFVDGLYRSPNMNARVQDPQKVVDAALEKLGSLGEISQLDGVYVHGEGWWINVRKSNTEPLVRIKYEATSQEQHDKLKAAVDALLKPFDPEFEAGA